MIGKEISDEEVKFKSYFEKYKKITVICEEERRVVKSYIEFLQLFLSDSYDSIEELEEFFICFIRCMAILNEVNLEVFYNSEGSKKEENIGDVKRLYLDDFESIINIIEELNIARILIVY